MRLFQKMTLEPFIKTSSNIWDFDPPTHLIALIVKSIFGKPPPLIDDVLYEPPLTITVNSLLEARKKSVFTEFFENLE